MAGLVVSQPDGLDSSSVESDSSVYASAMEITRQQILESNPSLAGNNGIFICY